MIAFSDAEGRFRLLGIDWSGKGMLLLLPGFVTDLVGFLCLVPTVRRFLVLAFFKRANVMQAPAGGARGAPRGQRIIEGEYRREDQ